MLPVFHSEKIRSVTTLSHRAAHRGSLPCSMAHQWLLKTQSTLLLHCPAVPSRTHAIQLTPIFTHSFNLKSFSKPALSVKEDVFLFPVIRRVFDPLFASLVLRWLGDAQEFPCTCTDLYLCKWPKKSNLIYIQWLLCDITLRNCLKLSRNLKMALPN